MMAPLIERTASSIRFAYYLSITFILEPGTSREGGVYLDNPPIFWGFGMLRSPDMFAAFDRPAETDDPPWRRGKRGAMRLPRAAHL